MGTFDLLAELLRKNGFDPSGLEMALEGHDFRDENDHEYAFQFIVENQRGMKFFGIPCFNRKSLIPVIDPPQYTRVDGSRVTLSDDHIENYPLPDLGWHWGWDQWYVLMLNDVDEQGWMYLSIVFRRGLHWHGKYNFGNFVRRRLWVRLRVRSLELAGKEPETARKKPQLVLEPGAESFQAPLTTSSEDLDVDQQAELSEAPAPPKRLPIALVTTWA